MGKMTRKRPPRTPRRNVADLRVLPRKVSGTQVALMQGKPQPPSVGKGLVHLRAVARVKGSVLLLADGHESAPAREEGHLLAEEVAEAQRDAGVHRADADTEAGVERRLVLLIRDRL